MIEVLAPGLLTTVQDLGRPGYGPIGVSAAGAADPTSLRIANRLLGNPEGAPALEMTLQGAHLRFHQRTVIALGGSDFGVPLWRPLQLDAGTELRLGRTASGARCYLAVQGGLNVPRVLGSASTHLLSGLGGGPLRRGDRVPIPPRNSRFEPKPVAIPAPRTTFRVTEAPQSAQFCTEALVTFYHSTYTVTPDTNRMGIRLQGPMIPTPSAELTTEGVALGAIQVPSGGQPVILFVDHQTTGGYAKIANVIAADLPALGQLKPGDMIRFHKVDLREARELLYIQERWLRSI